MVAMKVGDTDMPLTLLQIIGTLGDFSDEMWHKYVFCACVCVQ